MTVNSCNTFLYIPALVSKERYFVAWLLKIIDIFSERNVWGFFSVKCYVHYYSDLFVRFIFWWIIINLSLHWRYMHQTPFEFERAHTSIEHFNEIICRVHDSDTLIVIRASLADNEPGAHKLLISLSLNYHQCWDIQRQWIDPLSYLYQSVKIWPDFSVQILC